MRITAHAADRYAERVKPHLTRREASDELERLLENAELSLDPPEWVHDQQDSEKFSVWALVSDGITAACRPSGTTLNVITIMVRNGLPDVIRSARNREKSKRRRDRRVRNQLGGPRRP